LHWPEFSVRFALPAESFPTRDFCSWAQVQQAPVSRTS
jgi:hypothetical protein